MYEKNFESNRILFFHDLWEYIERKLKNDDGATVFVHPQSDNQHPSTSLIDPNHAYLDIKMANEIDAISDMSANLEKIIDDKFTPPEVRKQA